MRAVLFRARTTSDSSRSSAADDQSHAAPDAEHQPLRRVCMLLGATVARRDVSVHGSTARSGQYGTRAFVRRWFMLSQSIGRRNAVIRPHALRAPAAGRPIASRPSCRDSRRRPPAARPPSTGHAARGRARRSCCAASAGSGAGWWSISTDIHPTQSICTRSAITRTR